MFEAETAVDSPINIRRPVDEVFLVLHLDGVLQIQGGFLIRVPFRKVLQVFSNGRRRRNVISLHYGEESTQTQFADSESCHEMTTMNSKTKDSRLKKKVQAAIEEIDPDETPKSWREFLYRPKFLMMFATVVLFAATIPVAGKYLPEITKRPQYRISVADVEINSPHRYVPKNFISQVFDGHATEEYSILDTDLTSKVAHIFELHPWVAEVVRVEKSFPPHLKVALKYRVPVAMLEVKGGMRPIDAAGNVLPSEDFSVDDTKRFPVIRGIESTPQGPVGTNWGETSVIGSARLSEILLPYWKDLNLDSIRVQDLTKENRLNDMVFEIFTRGGSKIIWGRVPGTKHPGELSARQKIERLQKYVADFGKFDQPHGPYEIDIRHWREISRRPLTFRTEIKTKK